MIKSVLKDNASYVHVAYEWPRHNSGWGIAAMRQLQLLLPYVVEFDGCAYSLRSYEGELMKKPWR
eukprot:14994003-Heterocapsa_arctica.AAC.1